MIAETPYVPPLDGLGVPAWPWLFVVLMLVTLLLHLIFMNFALGGTLLAIGLDVSALLGRRQANHTANLIRQIMPIAISFTITTGVAPLLFVQVLYGHYFYTSNVLMGLTWLSFIGFLVAGFYLTYIVSNRGSNALLGRVGTWDDKPGRRLLVTLLAVLCFVAIGWILTNNHLLSTFPQHWAKGDHWRRNVLYAGHISVGARLVHFLIGTVAVAGLWITLVGWWRRRRGLDDDESTARMIRFGLWVTLICSGVNLLAGPAFLFHHDWPAVGAMFRLNHWMGWVFGATVFLLVPAHIVTMLLAIRQPVAWRPLALAMGVLVALLTGMAIGREHLRWIYLARPEAGAFSVTNWPVRMQVTPLLLFLVVFVLGLATVALLLKWLTARGPAPDKPTA